MAYNLQHGLWPCSIVCGPVAWPMVCSMTCGTVAWHVALSMACGPWLAAVQQGVQTGLGYGRRVIGQGRIMGIRLCPHGHGAWLKGLSHLIVLQLLLGAWQKGIRADRCACARVRTCAHTCVPLCVRACRCACVHVCVRAGGRFDRQVGLLAGAQAGGCV